MDMCLLVMLYKLEDVCRHAYNTPSLCALPPCLPGVGRRQDA